MQAQLADGRILDFPDGTDPKVIQETVKKLIANPLAGVSTEALEATPSSTSLGNFLRETGQGVVSGGQTLTDLFGAGNKASKTLEGISQYLQEGLTPERKHEMEVEQELTNRAKGDTLKAEAPPKQPWLSHSGSQRCRSV